MDHLIALTHICDSSTFEGFGIGKNVTDPGALIRELNLMAIKMNESLHECKWRGKERSCLRMFRRILTEDGICFTFNALNSQDIYSDM